MFNLNLINYASSGVAKVGNGWAQAQPFMSSAQPILIFIAQSILRLYQSLSYIYSDYNE